MSDRTLELVVLHLSVVVFKVLSASELFHHDHLILSHFWSYFKESIFLVLLGQIDNIGPALFIFCFERSEELIERFIFLCHFLNALIQRLAFSCLLRLYKGLQLLNFLNSSWPRQIRLLSSLRFRITEK